MLEPIDGGVPAGRDLRPVDLLHQRLQQDVVDERGLPRARHAGDRDEAAERDVDVDVLEVVLARASYGEPLLARLASHLGDRDRPLPGEVLTGQRLAVRDELSDRAVVHDLTAVLTRTGADVDDMVRDADR